MQATIDRPGIAALTGYKLRYITDVVTKRPDFPRPVQKLSQRNVRWLLADIQRWVRRETERRLGSALQ
jgi:predicted DNA-binding transcriptional regulator AlpA